MVIKLVRSPNGVSIAVCLTCPQKFYFKNQLKIVNSFKLVILIFALMMEFTFAKYQKGKRGDFLFYFFFILFIYIYSIDFKKEKYQFERSFGSSGRFLGSIRIGHNYILRQRPFSIQSNINSISFILARLITFIIDYFI